MENKAARNEDRGAARTREDDDIVHAIEDALADDTTQFFDVDSNDSHANNAKTPLTEEERESLQQELKKTEDEIATLRQVLNARLKHSNELKRKLGITPWVEVQQDLTHGVKALKETTAYQKAGGALHQASDVITKKFDQIRNSATFKSFEDKVGTSYNTVKAKISASASIDQLSKKSSPATPATQPTSPSMETAPPPQ